MQKTRAEYLVSKLCFLATNRIVSLLYHFIQCLDLWIMLRILEIVPFF